MKHKQAKSVLLRRLAYLLCGVVVLLIAGILGWTPVMPAKAITSTIDVVVNNSETAEISFDGWSYDFSLSLGACQKVTNHVTVETNSISGYSLYMAGGNTSSLGTNTLTNPAYSTADSDIFKSVTSSSTCDDMKTGNRWGYALVEGESASTFSAIPAANAQIATSSSTTGTYPVTVAVATADAMAGTYEGALVFTAVTQPSPSYFAIYYNDNYSGSGNYLVDDYSGTVASHAFTITSSAPTRSGYNFLGWSLSDSATSASYTSGNSLTLYKEPSSGQYGPVVTLYAVWQAVSNDSPAPVQTSSPVPNPASSSSQSTGDDNANSGYAAPQGVREEKDTIENLGGSGNLVPAIVALTVASVATGGFIFFVVAKRDDDDDEEEENGGIAK